MASVQPSPLPRIFEAHALTIINLDPIQVELLAYLTGEPLDASAQHPKAMKGSSFILLSLAVFASAAASPIECAQNEAGIIICNPDRGIPLAAEEVAP
ncbi:hypothetical protein AURDEDRAFT_169501 [Auricularia subglabra TFB-10046 SS5]|uniref:Uncharacterized protein n=1 Tax=Auricularia subglabra (strain TFB-10046 / SS5) TaxID=717982 RepID=J0DD83_AURST|nr:hypothetical protein AURDEDRAFT_169501 [Auricularia subglabra TFB-10046 SS5]